MLPWSQPRQRETRICFFQRESGSGKALNDHAALPASLQLGCKFSHLYFYLRRIVAAGRSNGLFPHFCRTLIAPVPHRFGRFQSDSLQFLSRLPRSAGRDGCRAGDRPASCYSFQRAFWPQEFLISRAVQNEMTAKRSAEPIRLFETAPGRHQNGTALASPRHRYCP